MELKNKVAVVTGVSKGLGLEIVKLLLEKGAIVAGWGRNQPSFTHPNFHFFTCDVADEAQVEQAYQATVARLGADIRILINNAGFGVAGPLETMSSADWKSMFDTNVHGIFYVTKRIIPSMKQADEGHIINVASTAGSRGFKNGTVYAASKFALKGMTQCWMHELRPHNIRVTLLSPSAVPTAFNVESREEKDLKDGLLTPNELAHAVVSVLEMDNRGFIPELEVWATNPF